MQRGSERPFVLLFNCNKLAEIQKAIEKVLSEERAARLPIQFHAVTVVLANFADVFPTLLAGAISFQIVAVGKTHIHRTNSIND
jgi:hypothetical protein